MLIVKYEVHFQNKNLVEKLIKSVLTKWYNAVNKEDYNNLVLIADILCLLIKASPSIIGQFSYEFILHSEKMINYALSAYSVFINLKIIARKGSQYNR